MKKNPKKLIIPNIPYLFIALIGAKLAQAVRLSPGDDIVGKLTGLQQGFALAFESPFSGVIPNDFLIGTLIAAVIRLAVYLKGRNARKFRKNQEYGSARWGGPEDIAPFVDRVARNNIILTKTESLMMSNRPEDPRNARNKNVLVIGGSGSGKTRFFLKPNLMQCHSSYVVTDPNGYTIRG